MDATEVALLITTVTGAIFGGIAIVRAGRTEKLKSRVDDTSTAFTVLNGTVQTLSAEVNRVSTELDDSRKETVECEEGRKELARLVGQQASEISEMKKQLQNLVSGKS